MRLIPVLDVLNGVVVRGIGGRRSEYRPVVSHLTTSTEPVEVAAALIEVCRPCELYLADLDAIQGATPALDAYKRILELGVDLWVDAGIRDVEAARRVVAAGCQVVAGLETVPNAESLREIVSVVKAARVVFSLDLKDGVPLGNWPDERPRVNGPRTPIAAGEGIISCSQPPRPAHAWPFAVASTAINCGITRLVVLDLARVGGGSGTGNEDLCRQIASAYSDVEVIAGGGVSGVEDLTRLADCGVRGVLVASALHDKRLPQLISDQ